MPWCHRKLQLSYNKVCFWIQITSEWTQQHRRRIYEFPGTDNKNPHIQLTDIPKWHWYCNIRLNITFLYRFFPNIIMEGQILIWFHVIWYWCSGTSLTILCVALLKQRYFLSSPQIFPLWTVMSFANWGLSDTIIAHMSVWIRFPALCYKGIHPTSACLT